MPTNSILKNRGLAIAVAVSVFIHAILLSVKFVTPSPSGFMYPPPVIEVVLGGGGGNGMGTGLAGGSGNISETVVNAQAPAEKIPEKNIPENKPAESRPITSLSRQDNQKSIPVRDKKENNTHKNVDPANKGGIQNGYGGAGGGRGEGDSVVFNRNARGGYEYGNGGGPAITAQSKDVGDAMYFKSVQKKVENIGVINFPQKNGTRLYGQLTVRINVYHDGSLYEKAGGVSVVKSSGNPALDAAALNIVRRAAPFGRFSGNVRSIITRLNFTRDQGLKSQVVTTTS